MADTMVEELDRLLIQSGATPQSREKLLRDLPRWSRRLRTAGYAVVPDLSKIHLSIEEVRCVSHVCLFMAQAADNEDVGHHLRNLLKIRPHKAWPS
jgi:hypothetical protein